MVQTLLCAATNSTPAESIPTLAPPRGEIPPTFWEQYGGWVMLSGVVLLGGAGAAIWFLTRRKPQVTLPSEVQARAALEALSRKPEDGLVLSHVSQVVRRYVTAAFALPAGELTTMEFCRLIAGHEKVGSELSAAIGGFLKQCDERKFAKSSSPAALGAATRALELVEASETRRAQLREAARIQEGRAEGAAVRLLILIFLLILIGLFFSPGGLELRVRSRTAPEVLAARP